MKIVVWTLGCKVNQYESDAISYQLTKLGHTVSNNLEFADIYILNTCAVTNEAEKKSRQMVAKFLKLNPNSRVLVCGCASEHNSEQFKKINGVTFIKGNAKKTEIINSLLEQGEKVDELPLIYDESIVAPKSSLSRAYVKIQDGCNNFCSYCLIPYVRGRSRSRKLDSIIEEVKLHAQSSKEIVLTGIDISDYKINGEKALATLLKELNKFNVRIRLGSLEVRLADEKFIKEIASFKNLCPHFHLSLQSGSNSVLKRMNRHYTCGEYLETVESLRKYFENVSITTDIIVGFPEETEEEFNETCEFVRKVEFAKVHIFPYSIREGTVASRMKQVDGVITKERVKKLEKIDNELSLKYISKMKNKYFDLLVEEKVGDYFVGHTENYIKVYVKDTLKENEIVKVKILQPFKDGALGII